MTETVQLAVAALHSQVAEQAVELAQQLGLPLIDAGDPTTHLKFLLAVVYDDHCEFRLELHFPNDSISPLCVDFLDSRLQYRQKFGGGRQQAIARAVGLKHGLTPTVVDVTAGLGRDAFVLASLGCQVHMLERHPVIHALLKDGLRRLGSASITADLRNRLTLEQAESQYWLEQAQSDIDVIYLDPMYPHRNKSALVKKEMRILRQLVGDDMDITAVLDSALKIARQRVIVKRPKTAVSIGAVAPTHNIFTKNTRFDVYLTSGNASGMHTKSG